MLLALAISVSNQRRYALGVACNVIATSDGHGIANTPNWRAASISKPEWSRVHPVVGRPHFREPLV
jgi:hypothetical protein